MAIKKNHLSIIFIFYCLWSLWAVMSLSGCNQTSKNILPPSALINGNVTLLWNEIPGANSYNIYMSKSPGVTKLSGLKIPNVSLNTFMITQLEPGETYYFVVTVANGSGESKESKELSYTAVVGKIGLVYWKNLFDKSIQDHKSNTAETRQEIKATPERTKTEAERPLLENEALIEKIAGDEKSSGDLAKETVAEPVNIEEDLTENSKPATVHIETGTDPNLLVQEETRLRAATAETRQEIKATPERTKTEAERPLLENEALIEKIAGDEKSSGDLAKETVAEPVNIEEDLTENSKPATVHIETGTDPNLLVQEEMRLRAALKYADSAFCIFFEENSNELSPKAIEKLDRIYEILTNNPAAKLTLNGYSNSIGAPSYNQMISEIRAISVKSYLSGKGIKASRMMAFGRGAQKFIASNKSAEGRGLNRRVEIELIIP